MDSHLLHLLPEITFNSLVFILLDRFLLIQTYTYYLHTVLHLHISVISFFHLNIHGGHFQDNTCQSSFPFPSVQYLTVGMYHNFSLTQFSINEHLSSVIFCGNNLIVMNMPLEMVLNLRWVNLTIFLL